MRFLTVESCEPLDSIEDIPFINLQEALDLPPNIKSACKISFQHMVWLPDNYMVRSNDNDTDLLIWKKVGVNSYIAIEKEKAA